MKRFTARLKQNWNGWGESVDVAKVYALVSWIDRKEWEAAFLCIIHLYAPQSLHSFSVVFSCLITQVFDWC